MRDKANELKEIKFLIQCGKQYKIELLDNLLAEQNFKVHLRSNVNKEQGHQQSIKDSMNFMRNMMAVLHSKIETMNSEIRGEIGTIKAQVNDIEQKLH